jgi:hypothetical protein
MTIESGQWEGGERRMAQCSSHEDLIHMLKSMNEKMDNVLSRQADHADRLGSLEGIVTNGLSSNVKEIKEQVSTLTSNMRVLEDHDKGFEFFRDFVISSRNVIFVNIIKIASVGGCVFLIWHFGDRVIKAMIG